TIIIMTSNLGSEYILENLPNKEELINKDLKRTFKPEFLNRIDEIVFFNSLNKDVFYQILDKFVREINDRLKDRGIVISLSDKAKKKVIDNASDEAFGARPIKRYLDENIETLITIELINGTIKDNLKVVVDLDNNYNFLIRNN